MHGLASFMVALALLLLLGLLPGWRPLPIDAVLPTSLTSPQASGILHAGDAAAAAARRTWRVPENHGKCFLSPSRWFSLAPHFTSHMVLQRKSIACLWGAASHPDIHLNVTVRQGSDCVAHQPAVVMSTSATGASTHRWEACLRPLSTRLARSPLTLCIESPQPGQCRSIQLVDVVVGDVFLCSGQSNMWFPLQSQQPKPTHAFPNLFIRTLLVVEAGSPSESQTLRVEASGDTESMAWTPATSLTAIRKFSAVCYLAAQRMLELLPTTQRVPLGLISAAARDKAIRLFLPLSPAQLLCGGAVGASQGTFWNSFFAPLRGTAVAAVLWYQGESDTRSTPGYACKLQALIDAWRRTFRSPGGPIPVLVVSLHAYHCRRPLGNALIRQQQMEVALVVPSVSLVPAFDSWPTVMSHPPDKTLIAQRAGAVLAKVLHHCEVLHSGPRLVSVAIVATSDGGTRPGAVQLQYDPSSPAPHHVFRRGGPCFLLCMAKDCDAVPGLWEAPAAMTIAGHTVTLQPSRSVSPPLHLKYAFSNHPTCFLYSQAGWPATPFWVTLNTSVLPLRMRMA
eukprot:GGOE01042274.1.p1 GENE.GGOE01042274.1~~GGOE01042274.1.p1  ORF type:complete len:565 (-),score=106.40 GGOE01042274.1:204-1898(-)